VTALLVAAALCLRALAPADRTRCVVGALFATYLALWTLHWTGGPWPPHSLALDVALALAVAALVWRTRARSALALLAACYGHFVVQARLLPIPTTTVGWGETVVAFGFALLAGSLLTSYRLRAYQPSVAAGPQRRAFGSQRDPEG
jgi:hypothetical protein